MKNHSHQSNHSTSPQRSGGGGRPSEATAGRGPAHSTAPCLRREGLPKCVRSVGSLGDIHHENPRRRGFVLAVVTISIVILALGAYNYTDTMLVAHEAAMMGGRDVVARTAAESAIQFAATRVMERDLDPEINLFHDPTNFRGRLLVESSSPRSQVRFSIVAFDEANIDQGGIRFGLASENSKFNLNQLLVLDQLEENVPEEERLGLAYMALVNIPNMTDDVVDAILDWLDSDEDRRPGGAESDYYEGLTVPYSCKNGAMESIDELLKIQGVTPELFYGEDRNLNGLLDAGAGEDLNENGILDLGWKDYLTASSRERNSTPDGESKINLNMGEMTELYDAVEELFGEEAASFIVAFRLAGTDYVEAGQPDTQSGIQDQISRNNIDLTIVPTYQFSSLYDLIAGETLPTKMISGTDQSFVSPWSEDANTLLNVFPDLEQNLTITDDAYIEGRININQARREVLLSIPNITETAPDDIIASRPALEMTGGSSTVMSRRNTAAWILAEGIVDLPTLRAMGPYITTGGDVYRFLAIGHYDEGGPTTRLEAMIDATVYPPAIMSVRDLTKLGRGYHPSLLLDSDSGR
ncbi:Type II secretory pathway, component PulK [Fuerstiella marisgermanici]|uniref:Type II secretory pathway, component PulK n=1 Tax=Fuerstiella marisgermanici TaxID=1891926 RepID=A0A1P8WCC6_9PLAN|nr:Type II secretory pathway, component PulK [Fuerstiella marisgermanici]